ncbi:ctenidin-3-like [Cynara cardunculus var. scolymus]|uniref:ctenidin-3-like n=1 Tax=Cynara cardunculus var. scolymus TaxID=59895 RepID=UPI000D624FEE|nr:ctenidin-3-like [Cynara cardunculus var. scolymus]
MGMVGPEGVGGNGMVVGNVKGQWGLLGSQGWGMARGGMGEVVAAMGEVVVGWLRGGGDCGGRQWRRPWTVVASGSGEDGGVEDVNMVDRGRSDGGGYGGRCGSCGGGGSGSWWWWRWSVLYENGDGSGGGGGCDH